VLNSDQHTSLLMMLADQHIVIFNQNQKIKELEEALNEMREEAFKTIEDNGVKHAPV